MITSAAVKLRKRSTGEEIILRCHRHGDVYDTLRKLGFNQDEFATVEQGFIWSNPDPNDTWNSEEMFLNREMALNYALDYGQIQESISEDELYSEDLW